jgi:hypothetical protein
MKKLIYILLLLPFFAIAQVSNGTETEFEALKTTNSQTITTPTYLTTTGNDGTQGKIPSAYIEKTANKVQTFTTVDGTGEKYTSQDAVEKLTVETAKVWSNTGLYSTYDETFYMQQLSSTTFRIHPVKRGFFSDELYDLPYNIASSIIENTPVKDVNVNTLGIPNVLGRYYRFIGYDRNLNVISSLSNFNSNLSTIGLGFVIVDADGLGNFVLAFPPTSLPTIAGNSQLERDLSTVLTNVNITPNNNNTFNSSAGNLTGSGIGWVSGVTSQGSPNKKIIPLQAITQFILQNPLTSSGLPPSFTTAVSGLNYWNGSAMVATGNNNYVVKRLLLSATGNYILQESEVRYTTGTKIENFNAAKTNATSQSFTNTGSLVPDTYAIVGYWVLDNASTPNLSDVTTYAFIKAGVNSGGGAAVTVPDATESVKGIVELATAAETTTGTDNTRAVHPAGLKVELDKKANDANVIHTTGNESKTGTLSFARTVTNPNAGINIAVTGSSGTPFISQTSSSNTAAVFISSSTGDALEVDADSSGNALVLRGSTGSTGNLVVVKDNTTTTALINKTGEFSGTKFVKTGATAGNILLAGGSDIGQSTFQTALINPITGTGTSGFLPKWTGTSIQGNSSVQDNGDTVGIGITPNSWVVGRKSLQIGQFVSLYSNNSLGSMELSGNSYMSAASTYNYTSSNYASLYQQYDGSHRWYYASSGIIGNVISFTESMRISNGGNILINTATDNGTDKVQVNGTISASPAVNPNQVVVKSQLDAIGATSGTYSPSFGNQVNISSLSATNSNYMRIGNTVTVSVSVSGSISTVDTITSYTITLPFSKTATNTVHKVGQVNTSVSGTHISGVVEFVSSNTAVMVSFKSTGISGTCSQNITFMYNILD